MSGRPPRMDALLAFPRCVALRERFGDGAVKAALNAALAEAREAWRGGAPAPSADELAAAAERRLGEAHAPVLRRVVNATGVILHTNLGRAPLPADALRQAAALLTGYVDLEVDLEAHRRGHRDARIEAAFQDLLDTDYAVVVTNNNAAATMLLLNSLSRGRETLVSRGELVEIGGGFRVPEVMAASGARLREVGTTNRTRADDYRAAAGPDSALLLKVHPSNYRIVGFTEEVALGDLVALGRELGLPAAMDLGSGLLVPPGAVGVVGEPTVAQELAAAPAALCFSADKLLGASQAGILLVEPGLAEAFRKNPLLRALRVDKITYLLLGAALSSYRRGRWEELPALRMLLQAPASLRAAGARLRRRVEAMAPGCFAMELLEGEGRAGGGAAPEAPIPSPLLAVAPREGGTEDLESFMRTGGSPPILGVLSGGTFQIHLRTLLPGDAALVAARLARYAKERLR